MTIHLNRHRLLPTIPEYRSDDNIKLAQAGDEMNLTNRLAAITETNRTNQTNQINRTNQTNRKNQTCRTWTRKTALKSLTATTATSDYISLLDSRSKCHHSSAVTEAAIDTINYFKRLSTLSCLNPIRADQFCLGAASLLNLFTCSTSTTHAHTDAHTDAHSAHPANSGHPAKSTTMGSPQAANSSNSPMPLLGKKSLLSRHIIQWLHKLLGRTIILMTMISFLFVGLTVNLVQLVLYITVHPISRRSFNWLNYYCVYMIYSPVLTIAYYWTNVKLNIRVADSQLIKEAFEPMLGLILLNHNYELDWLVCMVFGDQLKNLGAYKTIVKSDIKYLPVVGWSALMSQMIFVDRVWAKDKLTMGHKLNQLLNYKQTFIGLFCEGTRLTPAKHEASINYAKANNLTSLKHHLLPRPRGFTHCVLHLMKMKGCHQDERDSDDMRAHGLAGGAYNHQEVPFRIFNIEIVLPTKPTFKSFMDGESFQADFYVEEVDQNKFKNITNDNDMDQLLYDIYQRKDDLVDEYRANGNKFIAGHEFPFARRMAPLINWAIGFVFTFAVIIVMAIDLFGSVTFWLAVTILVMSSVMLSKKVSRETKVINSSPYGAKYLEKMRNAPVLNTATAATTTTTTTTINSSSGNITKELTVSTSLAATH